MSTVDESGVHRADCTSSVVKPSLFLVGDDEKWDWIKAETGAVRCGAMIHFHQRELESCVASRGAGVERVRLPFLLLSR